MNDKREVNDTPDLSDTGDWHEYLLEQLTDREEAIGFLHAVMEDFQLFEEPAIVMSAIESVIEAQGGIAALAKQTDMPPQTFTDMLVSDEAHHCLSTLQTLLSTFGCRLSIEPLAQLETGDEEPYAEMDAPAIAARQPMSTEAIVAENPTLGT